MYEKKIPKDFSCGMAILMEIIGGKWKSYLIYLIANNTRRPAELQRAIPSASRRVLDLQLRELEFHGIIKRVIYPEMPPKVEYFLTPFGESMLPVVASMETWGAAYMETFRQLMEAKQKTMRADGESMKTEDKPVIRGRRTLARAV
ncbi:winged helix-turn-helix transcriptional regulator [Chitinophaga oryzae]|uniref:Winged helix-turn-helix transcriptional regulator n=1 Tax=Chitinophaga oryzae TaxID=2725414 RepID=A0AAE6ZFL6_9BACT|nr:helix-turn-helix domain-containing protein [Chitinophaga oryzae]QJB32095.1 winged helix-turn-helix transcriptional regulator [Chitinophaga oryzae]QJB38573.1 winged helix-turn-helix transcriptional regulator [Chitinophaga oryzae]